MNSLISLDAPLLAKILGFSLGYLWGEAFSKWDYMIKYKTEWYQGLSPYWRWFIAGLLDTQHHFQYGLMIIIFMLKLDRILALFPQLGWLSILGYATPTLILTYLGIGLISSDWKDYQHVLERMGLRG